MNDKVTYLLVSSVDTIFRPIVPEVFTIARFKTTSVGSAAVMVPKATANELVVEAVELRQSRLIAAVLPTPA